MTWLVRAFILALCFCGIGTGQEPEWKVIKEMAGEVPGYPGMVYQAYAAKIARGDDVIKLSMKFEFPNGTPGDLFRDNVPSNVDYEAVARIVGGLELNCATLRVKAVGGKAEIYLLNGKHFRSKEPPFQIPAASILATYFCERDEAESLGPPQLMKIMPKYVIEKRQKEIRDEKTPSVTNPASTQNGASKDVLNPGPRDKP